MIIPVGDPVYIPAMALPKLKLEPGTTDILRSGRGYDNPRVMLQDIHEGLRELGEGAVLLVADDPTRFPASIGFVLYRYEGEGEAKVECSWEFFITIPQWRDSAHLLGPATRKVFFGGDRRHLVQLLMAGLSPETIEERLSHPMVQFIHKKVEGLAEQIDKARTETQKQEHDGRRSLGLKPHPAATLFMLEHQASVLRELAFELETGKHLT